MAEPGTLHDAFIDELRDTYDAERQLTKALPKMAKAASSPDLRAAIESLKAQIAVAEANARVAGVAYDQTLIRAPFTGIVLTKSANVGDIVTPFSSASGTTGAVVTMADMETLEVEADVSESSIAKITVEVTIRFGTATDDKISASGADMTKAGLGITTGSAGFETISVTGAATADANWLTVAGADRDVTITFDDGGVAEDVITITLSAISLMISISEVPQEAMVWT